MTEHSSIDAHTFHERTKYALVTFGNDVQDIRMGLPPNLGPAIGDQDPAIEPSPYKIYRNLEPIPLPREPISTDISALDAIASSGVSETGEIVPDLTTLSQLLLRTSGLLKEWTTPTGRKMAFRAAGCTGARYHLETYVVCRELEGLAAGAYHYGPHDHALRPLRIGDHRAELLNATGGYRAVAQAPVTLIVSSEFWRNAWRYQERAYRHAYWDFGTLLANLLPLATSLGLPAEVVAGFADAPVNDLVGIDGDREAALGLVTIGRDEQSIPSTPRDAISPLALEIEPSSPRELDFPDVQKIHRASELADGPAASKWRSNPLLRSLPEPTGTLVNLNPLPENEIPSESIEDVIVRRRSNRHYRSESPLGFSLFSTVLDCATHTSGFDAIDRGAPRLADLYLIVNNIEGVAPGIYVHHPQQRAIELLEQGDFRQRAVLLACGQEYTAQAHVNAYLLTDLDPVVERYGDRGYRIAQLDAGLTGGRLQLAAHALGLGAVGSTSADDEVTRFFSPHAAGKSFMFVAVFGERRKPSQQESEESSRYLNRDE